MLPRVAANMDLQPTALGVGKIAAILKVGIGPIAFPIYRCAAAEARAVRPLRSHGLSNAQ